MWAIRRQFLYALAACLALGLVLTGVWFAYFYHPATCTDGIRNQDELGIDCGGVCQKLCTAPRISSLWARSVEVAPGVYHAVAMVQNPETTAGTLYLPYKFSLYDSQNILIAEREGAMELFPGDIVPLFEPNILTGQRVPAHTFVEFYPAEWQKMNPVQNPIRVVSQSLDSATLHLTAHLQNVGVYPVAFATVTALLYDDTGNLVNASQTTLSDLPSRGEKDVTFTWQQPFSKPVVRFEITPRLQ